MKESERDLQLLNILKSIQVTATSIAITAQLVDKLYKALNDTKPDLTVVKDD